jgi:SPP1 gp7 family putative phage head morphogenesis protein
MPLPLLPRKINDPTAQDSRERRAMAEFERRIKPVGRDIKTILDAVPVKAITLSSPLITNADVVKYQFNVDTLVMENIGVEIDNLIDRMVLGGSGERDAWFINGFVEPAYQQGTGMAQANIAVQVTSYKLVRPNLIAIMQTDAYRTRLGYVRARVYEEMKGLTADMKKQYRTILTDGMAQGINPNIIAKQIAAQTDTSIVRARRIARTEITTALRRSRIDEAESATIDLGLNLRMMQLSALSATTRISHARRHAKLYTFEEARVWMSTSPNMINCKCTFVEVLVDADGKPWTPDIIAKAKAMNPNAGDDEE